MSVSGGTESPCIEGHNGVIVERVRQRLAKIRRKLRPGDIVNTNPRQRVGIARVFKPLSEAVQGTQFGHSALYDGHGHVIESRHHTVIKRPLEDLVRCNEVVVVRPKVPAKDRRRAVAWMKSHVGKDAFRVTLGNLVAHGAKPTLLSRAHEGARQKLDRVLCSSLIANAYAKVPFNKERRIADHRPVDLLHSDKVKVVAKIASCDTDR